MAKEIIKKNIKSFKVLKNLKKTEQEEIELDED